MGRFKSLRFDFCVFNFDTMKVKINQQFVVLLNGLHPSKVKSVFVISTKDFDLEPKATINRKGKLYYSSSTIQFTNPVLDVQASNAIMPLP